MMQPSGNNNSIRRDIGFRVLLTSASTLLLFLLLGQTMAFIDYNFTVSMGLQESSELVGKFGVAFNKAFGVADTVIYIPLLALGIIGLWYRKQWGLHAMMGAFAITAYWPVVNLSFILYAQNVPDFQLHDYMPYVYVLMCIMLYGIWGMLYLNHNRSELIS